jgi:hypothetical protein
LFLQSDPARQFSLDHATLHVDVQAIPQHTLKAAEERKKQDAGLKQMLKKIGNENLHRGDETFARN